MMLRRRTKLACLCLQRTCHTLLTPAANRRKRSDCERCFCYFFSFFYCGDGRSKLVAHNMSYFTIVLALVGWTASSTIAWLWLRRKKYQGQQGKAFLKARTLLVTAHPDDEAMFFVPALCSLESVSILCLSNGNYDGLGKVRELELYKCANLFAIDKNDVEILDEPGLQDGPKNIWAADLVAERVRAAVARTGATQIITFDRHGVSGHTNHCATYNGVQRFIERRRTQGRNRSSSSSQTEQEQVVAWELQSTPLFRKYTGVLDLAWTFLQAQSSRKDRVALYAGSPKMNWLVRWLLFCDP